MAAGGLAIALLVGAGARWYARARFGATDDVTVARVQTEINARFAETARSLALRLAHVSAAPDAVRAAARDSTAARQLFQVLDAEIPANAMGSAGITVYDASGAPLAWAGNVSDLPRDRIAAGGTMFAAPGSLGLRLVRVETIADPERPTGPPLASVVAEQLVEATTGSKSLADSFMLPTSIIEVAVRSRPGPAGLESSHAFAVRSPDGQVLAEAEVSREKLAEARNRLQGWTRASLLAIVGLTLLFCAAPILEMRRHATGRSPFLLATAAFVGLLVAARTVFWLATAVVPSPSAILSLELMLDGLLLLAGV